MELKVQPIKVNDVSQLDENGLQSPIVKNIDTIQGRGCGLISFDNLNNFKTFGVKGKVNLED